MSTLAYIRVSTTEQTVENQKQAIEKIYKVDKWFADEGVSGLVVASDRPAMRECLEYLRAGDTLVVAAIDRLGRNTVNVLETVKVIQEKGAEVVSMREGFSLSTPIGKAMLTMLSAVAELEISNLKERQMAGINRAKAEGKHLGRKQEIDYQAVAEWRKDNQKSIKQTSLHWGISEASVKKATAFIKP